MSKHLQGPKKHLRPQRVKAGIYHMTLAQIFFAIFSLDWRRQVLVALGVWWAQILIFSFRLWFYPGGRFKKCLIFWADFRTLTMHLLATRCMFLCEFVVVLWTTWRSGLTMILVCLVYDAQFFPLQVSKCMMPDFKSHVVYSILYWFSN